MYIAYQRRLHIHRVYEKQPSASPHTCQQSSLYLTAGHSPNTHIHKGFSVLTFTTSTDSSERTDTNQQAKWNASPEGIHRRLHAVHVLSGQETGSTKPSGLAVMLRLNTTVA